MAVTGHDVQAGAPRTFEFRGRSFEVTAMTPYQVGQIAAYLKDKFPSPLDRYRAIIQEHGDLFSEDERREMRRDALANMEPSYDARGRQTGGWPVTYNSPQGEQYMHAGPGLGKWLHVILSRRTPDLALEECEAMAVEFDGDDLERLARLMSGRVPDAERGDDGGEGDGGGDDADFPAGLPA
jgi:hypothetical protein